ILRLRKTQLVHAPPLIGSVAPFYTETGEFFRDSLSLAGVNRDTDGLDLAPLLTNTPAPWRHSFLVENYGPAEGQFGVWSMIRTETGKYIEYPSGEKEAYDLVNDPYEEVNIYNSLPSWKQQKLAAMLAPLKGTAIDNIPRNLPGSVGVPFSYQLQPWGGDPPFIWSAETPLPAGLQLDPYSGLISGVPANAGQFPVWIQVQSSRIATYTGQPQKFLQEFTFNIN
ncbi:MAG: hypothetical protein D6698_11335, partial [Gammaproteobacteria bacterium]